MGLGKVGKNEKGKNFERKRIWVKKQVTSGIQAVGKSTCCNRIFMGESMVRRSLHMWPSHVVRFNSYSLLLVTARKLLLSVYYDSRHVRACEGTSRVSLKDEWEQDAARRTFQYFNEHDAQARKVHILNTVSTKQPNSTSVCRDYKQC